MIDSVPSHSHCLNSPSIRWRFSKHFSNREDPLRVMALYQGHPVHTQPVPHSDSKYVFDMHLYDRAQQLWTATSEKGQTESKKIKLPFFFFFYLGRPFWQRNKLDTIFTCWPVINLQPEKQGLIMIFVMVGCPQLKNEICQIKIVF